MQVSVQVLYSVVLGVLQEVPRKFLAGHGGRSYQLRTQWKCMVLDAQFDPWRAYTFNNMMSNLAEESERK